MPDFEKETASSDVPPSLPPSLSSNRLDETRERERERRTRRRYVRGRSFSFYVPGSYPVLIEWLQDLSGESELSRVVLDSILSAYPYASQEMIDELARRTAKIQRMSTLMELEIAGARKRDDLAFQAAVNRASTKLIDYPEDAVRQMVREMMTGPAWMEPCKSYRQHQHLTFEEFLDEVLAAAKKRQLV